MRSQIENSYEAESKYHYDDLFVYCYLLLFYSWGYIIYCHKAKESSLPGKMKIYSRYSNISITHILKGAACLHLSPMLCEGELWDFTKKVYLFLCTHNLKVVAECISKNSLSQEKMSTIGLRSAQGFEWLELFLCLGVYWSERRRKYMQRRGG